MSTIRPALSPALSGTELRRWYWTLQELTALARELAVPRGGGKRALTERLAAALDGAPVPAPVRSPAPGRQLVAPLTDDTVIPAGQRCSHAPRTLPRADRAGVHVRHHMRAFIASGAGRTLGDAVAHWHATRDEAAKPRPIGAQFKLNAFLRRWRRDNPDRGREEALAAWRHHRALPADARAAVAD